MLLYKKSMLIRAALLCVLLVCPSLALAWPGVVLDVHDGDTLTVRRTSGDVVKVRLYGVDAPELAQPGGPEARDYLRAMLADAGTVDVRTMDTDRYGRVVGRVQHGDVDVNAALLDAGQAWVYPQYCQAIFPCAEWVVVTIRAALGQRGLWAAGMPQPPWDWRRERRAARADAE